MHPVFSQGTVRARRLATAFAVLLLACLCLASLAQASRGVVDRFGGEGSGDGQISYGAGVDVYAATGDVYVADSSNNRVERFSADGSFELAFGWGVADGSEEFEVCTSGCREGNPGAGAGQFAGPYQGPREIAVDQADGSVYVLDTGNARIEKFDKDGNFLRAFGWGVLDGSEELQSCTTSCQAGSSGSGAGQIDGSQFESGLAVDPINGDVLAADPMNERVQEYSSTGAFVRMFGGDVEEGGGEGFEVCTEAAKCKPGIEGSEVGMFGGYQPHSVDVDSSGDIFTSDASLGRILEFTPSGGTLTPSVFATVEALQGLAVDRSTGHLVAIYYDYGANRLKAVELDGAGNPVDRYLGGLNTGQIPALAFNEATGRGYVLANNSFVYVLDNYAAPAATIEPATSVSAIGATLNGSVNSNGAPETSYRFEYSLEGSGEWISTTPGTVPGDTADHQVSAEVAPLAGLEPNSVYRFRLVAEKPYNEEVVSAEETFTTLGAAPVVETVGSPFRTATTARLDSRVNPRGAATSYRFEWGTTSAYGNVAPTGGEDEAGSGLRSALASAQVTGLQPGTTYHYRVVATNAFGTSFGEDMTVTTRASDEPLSHGHFAGPPGSDRAYEQVNMPDTGGNPVHAGFAFSDDGNRAVYQVSGGTPQSDNGTLLNQFFAERTADGWKSSSIWPTRADSTGTGWDPPAGNSSLTRLMAQNILPGASEWILTPGASPQRIFDVNPEHFAGYYETNDQVTRVFVLMRGTVDPDHPMGESQQQLYDVTSGTPHLVSILPDGSAPTCGVSTSGFSAGLPGNYPNRATHWVSADGSRVFFPSSGDQPGCDSEGTQLYMRDLETEQTVEISGPPVSGRQCSAALIKSTPDAAFFWSQSRLDPADSEPTTPEAGCGFDASPPRDGDIYRYDFADGTTSCLTCGFGQPADVFNEKNAVGAGAGIAVAEDGSRVYFTSPRRLVPGEGTVGGRNVYRLDVASGNLKFVSPDGNVGDVGYLGGDPHQAITPSGAVIVFASQSPLMNALTGSDNHGVEQYYRYDDRDGSLLCVSCPRDGSAPGPIAEFAVSEDQVGPNTTPIDNAGDFAFVTSTPLVAADQNTVKPGVNPGLGNDVYEWRDGRVLLVTDGKTNWPGTQFNNVGISGVSPSGRDIYFTAPEQLTPDAPDGFTRLYDARIGGGFEFPQPEPPCPLETCQGEAKGAPNDPLPASGEYHGSGNVTPPARHRHRRKCRHGRKRCAKHPKHAKKHATNNGRAH